MSSGTDERRSEPRQPVQIQVDVSTPDMFVSNYVTNISRGGVFIRSEKPLPIATEVVLKLKLPDAATTIEARGRVVWNYDIPKGTSHVVSGMGIKFLEMAPQVYSRLEGYVQRLVRASRSPS